VAVEFDGAIYPLIAKAAVCVPAPANPSLAVAIDETDVQLVPSHNSVAPVFPGVAPPKAIADV
jgi:hypothetical protein